MPFAVLVLIFAVGFECDNVLERVVLVVATAALLAALWASGARGRVALAGFAAVAAAAVWAVVDAESVRYLADFAFVGAFYAPPLFLMIVAPLVLLRKVRVATAVLVCGWIAVLFVTPAIFLWNGACGALT